MVILLQIVFGIILISWLIALCFKSFREEIFDIFNERPPYPYGLYAMLDDEEEEKEEKVKMEEKEEKGNSIGLLDKIKILLLLLFFYLLFIFYPFFFIFDYHKDKPYL
jgi:Na+/melibiose symporter-like transporter